MRTNDTPNALRRGSFIQKRLQADEHRPGAAQKLDIAVPANGRIVLMIGRRSTINPNMPLRFLEYVAHIHGNTVDSKAKISRRLVPLARPELIVFCTGRRKPHPEGCLYLSDAFRLNSTQNPDLTLELKVKVCTIRSEKETAHAHLRKRPPGRLPDTLTSGIPRGRKRFRRGETEPR